MLIALVVVDLVDRGVRAWFDTHAFTTAALTSVLVLLITVLIVDRVVSARAQHDRRLVIAAQAAIVSRQAGRTVDLVKQALGGSARREPAADELRTYMAMLLVSAPVLIESPTARTFLERAQRLAGLMSVAMENDPSPGSVAACLDTAADAMRVSVQPLLAALDLAQLRAVQSEDTDGGSSAAPRDGGDQARAGT
ncbi:MAG TPA: hypothetical protein VKV21_04345 [Solirubrobacteraceae bacterium]|nr:hypothetical protein [Solirubrobacteraceae bacterium]